MYTQYFGLRENPFALPPDPRYLYLSLRHQEALAHLMYGIVEGGGFVQLTGEVGTGKTMMIRALLERLPENVDTALVLYPFLSVQEFIRALCDDLRVPLPAKVEGTKPLIDALNLYLLENHAKGRRTVLIIDEAQKLSHEVLEQVRLLTNLETTKQKLLQILLIGQPELNSLLAQDSLRQLAQRVTARYNLQSLTPSETAEYIVHRCRVAGAPASLFTRGAIKTVHRTAHGIPRLINVICDRALLGAYGRGKNTVTGAMVRRAVTEISAGTGSAPTPRRPWLRGLGLAIGAFAVVALGAWQYVVRLHPVTSEPVAVAAVVPAAPAASPQTQVDVAIAIPGVPADEGGDTSANTPPPPALAELLNDPAVPTNTETAFVALFGQWRKDYRLLSGSTGCARAVSAGMQCMYVTGTWNNLRRLNRPAMIELIDADSAKHHVLVRSLDDDQVALEIGGKAYEYPVTEVDRFWFGKMLLLWTPPPTGEQKLVRGMRGPGVVWARRALARYYGEPVAVSADDDVFDEKIEDQVRDFQRRHQIEDDGIIGRNTLIQLAAYDTSVAPPLLSKLPTAVETP